MKSASRPIVAGSGLIFPLTSSLPVVSENLDPHHLKIAKGRAPGHNFM